MVAPMRATCRAVTSSMCVKASLLAVPFDLKRLEVSGGPVGVVPDVMQAAYVAGQPNDSGAMQASVSSTGTLVYVTGGMQPPTEYSVMLLDRTGRGSPLPIPRPGLPNAAPLARRNTAGPGYGRPRPQHLGLRLRARGFEQTGRRRAQRNAGWTPDGERITYGGGTKGPNNLHWIRADGGRRARAPRRERARNFEPGGWTPNGRDLLYYEIPSDAGGRSQAGTDPVGQEHGRERRADEDIPGPFPTMGGVDVSPDGRLGGLSFGRGRPARGVRRCVSWPGPRLQVSTDGGGSPIWRADGRELVSRPGERRTWLAEASGPSAWSGEHRGGGRHDTTDADLRYAAATVHRAYSMNAPARAYDVSGDGRRFLLLQPREAARCHQSELSVVQNWSEELKRLVPR